MPTSVPPSTPTREELCRELKLGCNLRQRLEVHWREVNSIRGIQGNKKSRKTPNKKGRGGKKGTGGQRVYLGTGREGEERFTGKLDY